LETVGVHIPSSIARFFGDDFMPIPDIVGCDTHHKYKVLYLDKDDTDRWTTLLPMLSKACHSDSRDRGPWEARFWLPGVGAGRRNLLRCCLARARKDSAGGYVPLLSPCRVHHTSRFFDVWERFGF